jgi:hypothetical protein
MFLQNLLAAIRARRRRSAQRHLQKTGPKLPKRWQELLDVANQKQIEPFTRAAAGATEARRLHDKTGT